MQSRIKVYVKITKILIDTSFVDQPENKIGERFLMDDFLEGKILKKLINSIKEWVEWLLSKPHAHNTK